MPIPAEGHLGDMPLDERTQQALPVLAIGAVVGLLLTKAYDTISHRRNPDPNPLSVNIPSLHGGRRPDSKVLRYISLVVFPLAMVTMMISFMLGAMGSPTPKDMPVTVVGSSTEQAKDTIAELEKSMGEDMFDFTAASSEDEARAFVEDREEVAALVPPTEKNPEFGLIANESGNNSAHRVVNQIFYQVASAQDMVLDVDNVVPLPDRDKNGVVVMYVAMGWTLAGFVVVVVGANANPWSRPLKRMVPLTAVYAPFMSLVIALIAGPLTGTVDGYFGQLWGAGILAIFCIAMFALVFERLIGMLAIIPVIGTLMFAGIPASNGSISEYMAQTFFSTEHDFGNLHLEQEREANKQARKQAKVLESSGPAQTVQSTTVEDAPGEYTVAPTAGDGQSHRLAEVDDEYCDDDRSLAMESESSDRRQWIPSTV